MLRLPEFVTTKTVSWAREASAEKKRKDLAGVESFTYQEGLCIQCVRKALYDREWETLSRIRTVAISFGYMEDLTQERPHYEIYLSDSSKTPTARKRTFLRISYFLERKNTTTRCRWLSLDGHSPLFLATCKRVIRSASCVGTVTCCL